MSHSQSRVLLYLHMHGLVLNDSVSLLAESTRLLSKRHPDSAHQSTTCHLPTSRHYPQHSTHHQTYSSHGGEKAKLQHAYNDFQPPHTQSHSCTNLHACMSIRAPGKLPVLLRLLTATQPNTPKLWHNLPTPVNGSSKTDLVQRPKRAAPHLPPLSSHWQEALLDLHYTTLCTQRHPCSCPHRLTRDTAANNHSCVTVSYCYHVQRNYPRRPLASRFPFTAPSGTLKALHQPAQHSITPESHTFGCLTSVLYHTPLDAAECSQLHFRQPVKCTALCCFFFAQELHLAMVREESR